jgi:hypothetical protein
VTTDRLTGAVVEQPADGEQPHYLLRTNSVDLPDGGGRVFPAMDADA